MIINIIMITSDNVVTNIFGIITIMIMIRLIIFRSFINISIADIENMHIDNSNNISIKIP